MWESPAQLTELYITRASRECVPCKHVRVLRGRSKSSGFLMLRRPLLASEGREQGGRKQDVWLQFSREFERKTGCR
ncbi:hypothetical protein M404DRAFT_357062 [Pisolithus tinctorius Marx 270]|uniref:Uncharacterized protein n=1 Tax=Pisolithus tinctorius Marx 270 TaxID=870435 RepID=A0A0C3PIQ3_PISTI|nr:hypothetical protein M404DRAFT_357062 [Pisolithus tinctorius Marx 270]